MKKNITIYDIIGRNKDMFRYLTTAEIAKRTGYSEIAVTKGRSAYGIHPYLKSRRPWYMINWRLSNKDISNVYGIPMQTVAQTRCANEITQAAYDNRVTRQRQGKVREKLMEKAALSYGKFKQKRAWWLANKAIQ